jgi:hypothetical protein
MKYLLIIFSLIFGVTSANSHDWYPLECCSEKDCAPIPDSDVELTNTGYRIKSTGEHIPYKAARMAPDGQYHVCRYTPSSPIIKPMERPLCFWAPMTGM